MDVSALAALRQGRAFVDLSSWRKVLVRGPEARMWLNDLLTAELGSLEPGRSRPALLLTPTGRIRAAVSVARIREGHLLVQDPAQPFPVDELLGHYVLSSDVDLEDATASLSLLGCPGRPPPAPAHGEAYFPSCLGTGWDLVARAGEMQAPPASGSPLVDAGGEELEAWRVERGVARFPIDLTEDSLPHEARLDQAIDDRKGCYLGQEAVAKVRNLGHPRWVVLAMRSAGRISRGERLFDDGSHVGLVTSAVTVSDGSAVIARVRWDAREGRLATESGVELTCLGLASGPR